MRGWRGELAEGGKAEGGWRRGWVEGGAREEGEGREGGKAEGGGVGVENGGEQVVVSGSPQSFSEGWEDVSGYEAE